MSEAFDSTPWFNRGQTLGNTDTAGNTNIPGSVRVFEDKNPNTQVVNSNVPVECVAVRNSSGGAITPGQVVKFKSTAILGEVDGNGDVDSVRIGVVDEYLPAAGCASNDICWVVTKGPTTAVSSGTINQATFVSVGTSGTAGKLVASVANKTVGLAIAAAASNLVRVLLWGRVSTP